MQKKKNLCAEFYSLELQLKLLEFSGLCRHSHLPRFASKAPNNPVIYRRATVFIDDRVTFRRLNYRTDTNFCRPLMFDAGSQN